nr:MAG TPA: hypothetical protein [Caudoviricetes sp.]
MRFSVASVGVDPDFHLETDGFVSPISNATALGVFPTELHSRK